MVTYCPNVGLEAGVTTSFFTRGGRVTWPSYPSGSSVTNRSFLLSSFVPDTFCPTIIHSESFMSSVWQEEKPLGLTCPLVQNLSHTTHPSSAPAFWGFPYQIFAPSFWRFPTPPVVPGVCICWPSGLFYKVPDLSELLVYPSDLSPVGDYLAFDDSFKLSFQVIIDVLWFLWRGVVRGWVGHRLYRVEGVRRPILAGFSSDAGYRVWTPYSLFFPLL